jgi:hypothetical protein
MSAKSEVVTVCSRQSAGDERLQSTAMILIMAGEVRRFDVYGGRFLSTISRRRERPRMRWSEYESRREQAC